MAVEERCLVETWADFGFSGISCTPKVIFARQRVVFICNGCDEVYVFCTKERKLTAVLQFPGSVTDLVVSHDKQLLYVACDTEVHRVSLQVLLSRAQSSPTDVSSSPTVLKISELVVLEKAVSSLLLVGSVLLTLSLSDRTWMVTLYSRSKQSTSGTYEKLTSFSLPLVSGLEHINPEGNAERRRRPVLICVHSSDTSPPSCSSTCPPEKTSSDSHIYLNRVLFKLLFGIDAALAKSPVVLCGLPDGCLYFLPLNLPGSRLQVLHSLEQPVVFVGISSSEEFGLGHDQCLVAVGELGRMVLIKTKEGGPDKGGSTASFTESCVPGPVMCGCIDKNFLYYSVGSDLLKLDLSAGSFRREGRERDEETSSETGALFSCPASLNVCRLITLAVPTCNTTGEVQLLGLSVRGQLQRIALPTRRQDTGSSNAPTARMGRSVKDLLSAIGDVCERATSLKTAIKSRNQILKHLNQVLNICFLLTASEKGDLHTREEPIRCHGVTEWSKLLQKDSLNLTCVLNNSSNYALERGWTLSITVFPLSYSLSEGGQTPSANFLFPFQNILSGESLEVSLPLATAGDAAFPMTASCSLIFSLSSLLGEEVAHFPGVQKSCISLPLNNLTVDWLHALRVNSPVDIYKTALRSNTMLDTVQAFLRSHWIRCGGRGEGGESASKPEPEQYSASVRVSLELLGSTLGLKNAGLDPQGQKPDPQHVCHSLLEWLLSEGPGGVSTGPRGEKISSPVVQAQGPNGHTVKLTVKEVNVGGENGGEEESILTTVAVQVESSSIAAVCGLHHAVLRRVQTLLQRAPETAASTRSIQSLGLRQALQRVEHLLQRIQQSRVSGAFGIGASTVQTTRSLLAVYLELRENPLVIV